MTFLLQHKIYTSFDTPFDFYDFGGILGKKGYHHIQHNKTQLYSIA